MDKPYRLVTSNTIMTCQCPTHRCRISDGTCTPGPVCFDNTVFPYPIHNALFLLHSHDGGHLTDSKLTCSYNKPQKQTKNGWAWSVLGFWRIQSNLPSISRLAFDAVDGKGCEQNSLSLLINSLRRTLKIFNYTVWKAAVTRSGWSLVWRSSLCPPEWNIFLFSRLRTPRMGLQ